MQKETLVAPGPTPSCRLDYCTWSFKVRTPQEVDDLLNLGWSIGHKVMPNGEMNGPRQGRIFQHVWHHDSGVTVEFTPPDSKKKNAGTAILSVSGSVFAALDPTERKELYIEVYKWPGFYRCTRIDTQFTVLEPPITIYEFVDACQSGKIWAKGFSAGRPFVQLDRSGGHRIPPTWYFGAPDSPTIARIYRHGGKHGWVIDDVRFEVQQRKRNADDTFRALVKQLMAEEFDSPLLLTKEANVVKAISREKLDIRDTSAIDREALGGKWLRKAPRVSWYSELVDAPGAPVERTSRPVPTLDQSVGAMIDQYGGKGGAHILQTMILEGCTIHQAAESLAMRMIGTMREQHRVLAKTGLTAAQGEELDVLYSRLSEEASRLAEYVWCE